VLLLLFMCGAAPSPGAERLCGEGCDCLSHKRGETTRSCCATRSVWTRLLRTLAPRLILMGQEKAIELEGKITSVLAGTMFRVQLPNDHVVLAHISGKMRKRFIRLTTGDRVKIEMSPYDIDKARIVYRLG
jgi:translation initiation factor IF-1